MNISQISGTIFFIAAFTSLILAFAFLFKGKSKVTFHLGLAAFFIAAYAFCTGNIYLSEYNKLLWYKSTGVSNFIIAALITFVYYFTGRTKYIRLKIFLWYLPAIIIFFFALATPYFIAGISPGYPYPRILGPLDPLGRTYIIIGLAISLFYLLREYFKSTGFKRWQLKYFILAISIHAGAGIILAGAIPLLYPKFFYDVLGDFPALFSIPTTILITYAIFKKQLFAMRFILTEILIGVIAIILLLQTLIAQTLQAKILGFIILFSFLFVGYLLVRATQKEIQRKEEAERLTQELKELNKTLEDRVKERTQELEKSYQEIKARKEKLEKFYNLTVGRELKMIELKKEIQELKKKLGELR